LADRFSGVDRGRALRGSRAIATYLLGDPEAPETVFALPRDEFGIITLGRDLTAFTGWLDHAVAARARTGKGRRRAISKAAAVETETAVTA
jgi:hypothetical protein